MAGSLLLLCGCVNDDLSFYETRLVGTVESTGSDPGGRLYVVLHHARSNLGDGLVEHPLGPFDEWEQVGRRFDRVVSVPSDGTEGLVVYAWIDADGDGELCAPGADPEPSGLVELDAFPAHHIELTLILDASCRGAEGLYP